jgi:hypothetical protein
MGRIPMDLGVNYQRNPEPPAVPRGFGMERFNKVAERGQVIAGLGAKVADIATDYAAKNKQADLRADALAAQSQFKIIQTEAQLKASETDDPNEIRQIWADAHGQYSSWVVGKSEKGVPNIRWSDQQKEMVTASDALQGEFRTTAELRIAEVGKRNSNAKALQAQRDAEVAGDRETITQAVQVRIENGTLTREEGEVERRASFLKSDLTLAKNNILNIEGMEPAKALEAATAFETALNAKEEDGSWAAFEHIPDAERKILIKQAKDSAVASANRMEAEDNLQVTISDFAYRDAVKKKNGALSPAEMMGLNLRPETLKKVRDLEKEQAKDNAATQEYALEMNRLVRAYDAKADSSSDEQIKLQAKIMAMPDGANKTMLINQIELKAAGAGNRLMKVEPDDVKDLQASITDQLLDLVERANFDGKNEYSGGRYSKTTTETGQKVGVFHGDLSIAAGAVQSMVDSYVAKNKPSADQLLDWYNTNPSIKALRDDMKLKDFIGRLPSMLGSMTAASSGQSKKPLKDSLSGQFSGGNVTDQQDALMKFLGEK